MTKPPQKFGPEGARYNRANWTPQGSEIETRLTTYIDKVGVLESTIASLKRDLEQSNSTNIKLSKYADDLLSLSHETEGKLNRSQQIHEKYVADHQGDVDLIAALRIKIAELSNQLSDANSDFSRQLSDANIEIEEYKNKLTKQIAKFDALYLEAYPPKKRWVDIVEKFPLIISVIKYRKEKYYRDQINFWAIFLSISFLIYFAVAGFFISNSDPESHCFRSAGSYFHCGVVRGIIHPLKSAGAWLIGRGGKEPEVLADTSEPASSSIVASAAPNPTPRAYTPPPRAYIPPPQRVIDPNVIVKDLADHVAAKATELQWTPEQISCARRETIDAMRRVYVDGYGKGDRERRFDAAKSLFGTVRDCNISDFDPLMDDMFYDDQSFFRKIQDRIENREFGDVWPN